MARKRDVIWSLITKHKVEVDENDQIFIDGKFYSDEDARRIFRFAIMNCVPSDTV
jgi:hypothetical protein